MLFCCFRVGPSLSEEKLIGLGIGDHRRLGVVAIASARTMMMNLSFWKKNIYLWTRHVTINY
jgi:hypothetical protein